MNRRPIPRWLAHYPHIEGPGREYVLASQRHRRVVDLRLRPHLIWGPRDRHLIPRLLARARSGRLRRVGDGTNLVDMIYVENAAEAHLRRPSPAERPDSPARRPGLLPQPGRAGQLLAVDRRDSGVGRAAAGRASRFRFAPRGPSARCAKPCTACFGLKGDPPMTRFLAAQLATSHYFDIAARGPTSPIDHGFRPPKGCSGWERG